MARRTSQQQFDIMIYHFEKCPKLLSGKIDPLFSKENKDSQWEELASALNADGSGPAKSTAEWRRTLKDWKCYVKRKAAKIANEQKQTGGGPPGKDQLTTTEVKPLSLIGEVAAHGQNSVPESPICGFGDLNTSSLMDDSDIQMDRTENTEFVDSYDVQNYCGNRKAVKRKLKNSIAAEVCSKLILSQNEATVWQRKIAENNLVLVEQQAALLDRRTIAAERKATAAERKATAAESKAIAKEQLVLLQEQNLLQQRRNNIHDKIRIMRSNRLQYL